MKGDNKMSQLKDNLDQILQEKETKIIPENIKKDVQIFDITGTLEAGIDTSNANATSLDIAEGKTAYVNGEKITGTLDDHRNNGVVGINLVSDIQTNVADTKMIIYTKQPADIVADYTTNFNVNMEMSKMAEAIGLTDDKIKVGETILGIQGSVIELKGQEKTINPTTQEQIITSDINYNAITKLTINPVTSSIDSNIVAENIKNGVTVLGVTGTYTEGVITEGSSPIFNNRIIMMDIPYTNLNRNADINTVMFGDFNSLTSLELDEDAWLPDEMHGEQSNPDYVSPLIHVAGILTNEIRNATIILYYCTIQSRNHWSNSANNSNYIYLDLYNSNNDLICSLDTNINKSFQKMNTMRDSSYFIGVTYNLSTGIVEQIFTQFDHAQLRAVPIE